jgi:hypothetical protein
VEKTLQHIAWMNRHSIGKVDRHSQVCDLITKGENTIVTMKATLTRCDLITKGENAHCNEERERNQARPSS